MFHERHHQVSPSPKLWNKCISGHKWIVCDRNNLPGSIVGVRWRSEDLTGSGVRLSVSLLIYINPSTIGFVAHKLCRIMLDPHCIWQIKKYRYHNLRQNYVSSHSVIYFFCSESKTDSGAILVCDNEKSKMCTCYFNFLDRQYEGCLSHEPTIVAKNPWNTYARPFTSAATLPKGAGGDWKGAKFSKVF